MTEKPACTKEGLVELRKSPNSFFHSNYLIEDAFVLICEYTFYQKVIKWPDFDPCRITFDSLRKKKYAEELFSENSIQMHYDDNPLLIELPEMNISSEIVKTTDKYQIAIDMPPSVQDSFNGIFEGIDRHVQLYISNPSEVRKIITKDNNHK